MQNHSGKKEPNLRNIIEHIDPDWSKFAVIWPVLELYEGPARGRPEFDLAKLGTAFSPARINELPHPIVSPVLVIGGGSGLIPLFLAKQGHDVTSIDSCKEMVQLSQERASKEKTKIKIQHCDGKDLDFPESFFNTVIINTGVITQTTLHSDSVAEILKRSHKILSPNGRLLVTLCLETPANHFERHVHKALGLNQKPSNCVLFLEDGTLESVRNKFLEKKNLDAAEVKKIFRNTSDFLQLYHAKFVAIGKELRKKGYDPVSFVGRVFRCEMPYLNGTQQKELLEKVGSYFKIVESKLMSDHETAYIIGQNKVSPDLGNNRSPARKK
ncbi:MAG: class I SAM-dependent methyltransferase [Candidatus Micrarchaeota archaeon]